MEPIERITIDPNVCHGRPTLRGLRYTVAMALELLSAGMAVEEILGDYEDLEREDILAVLAYSANSCDCNRSVAWAAAKHAGNPLDKWIDPPS